MPKCNYIIIQTHTDIIAKKNRQELCRNDENQSSWSSQHTSFIVFKYQQHNKRTAPDIEQPDLDNGFSYLKLYVCVCVCVRARVHTRTERKTNWSDEAKLICVCVCVRARACVCAPKEKLTGQMKPSSERYNVIWGNRIA